MRFINTRVHGVLDYTVGILLIALPWIFHFEDVPTAKWISIALGLAALVYSLFTDYELGMFKQIPMRTHLLFDLLSGILLAASPWLFQFSDQVFLPHLVFGLFEILASVCTKQVPGKVMVSER